MALYAVSGIPPGAAAAAFFPVPPPTRTEAGASSYGLVSATIRGILGNTWLALGAPASVGPHAGVMGDPGEETRAWKPSIYWSLPQSEYVRAVNRNELPIPAGAINPAGAPVKSVARRQRLLGRFQTPWPRAAQKFPPVTNA